jgi:hypothetical protein
MALTVHDNDGRGCKIEIGTVKKKPSEAWVGTNEMDSSGPSVGKDVPMSDEPGVIVHTSQVSSTVVPGVTLSMTLIILRRTALLNQV